MSEDRSKRSTPTGSSGIGSRQGGDFSVACDECGNRLPVRKRDIGGSVRCHTCAAVIHIPDPSAGRDDSAELPPDRTRRREAVGSNRARAAKSKEPEMSSRLNPDLKPKLVPFESDELPVVAYVDPHKRSPWVAILVALTLVGVIVALGANYFFTDSPPRTTSAPSGDPDATAKGAKAVAKKFLSATTADHRAVLVWDADLEKISAYEAQHASSEGIATRLEHLGTRSLGGKTVHEYRANFQNSSSRVVAVIHGVDGSDDWKVDWDSFDKRSSATWDTLLSGSVRSGEMRVIVSAASVFRDSFPNPSKYRCLAIKSPSPEISRAAYAYAELQTDLSKKLNSGDRSAHAEKGTQIYRAIVSIEAVENSFETRQFLLKDITWGWVKPTWTGETPPKLKPMPVPPADAGEGKE